MWHEQKEKTMNKIKEIKYKELLDFLTESGMAREVDEGGAGLGLVAEGLQLHGLSYEEANTEVWGDSWDDDEETEPTFNTNPELASSSPRPS